MPRKIKRGEANFRPVIQTLVDRESCSTCGYFDSRANSGAGECLMGVPEADFRRYPPKRYTCDFWIKERPF